METNPKPKKGTLGKRVDSMEKMQMAVIVVLVVGFITLFVAVIGMLLNAQMWGADTYKILLQELNENNNKIDKLIDGQNDCSK